MKITYEFDIIYREDQTESVLLKVTKSLFKTPRQAKNMMG